MAFTDAESRVRAIADRIAASSGLEVVEVELLGGAGKGGRILRVYIEKDEMGRKELADKLAAANGELKLPSNVGVDQLAGVTHDDLESFSRELGTILDVEEAIPGGAYTLEVSSPGLDRKLTRAADYQRFSGSLVKLTTREAINGNRHYTGRIRSFMDGQVTITLEQKKKPKPGKAPNTPELTLPLNEIEKAQLVPEI